MIEATRTEIVGADGKTGITLTFDMLQAQVPERRYVAETASVVDGGQSVQLCFAQRKLGVTDELRSLLVVHVPYGPAKQLVRMVNELENIKTIERNVTVGSSQLIDIKQEPPQTVALISNIIAVSFVGREACVDFYHSSPFVIADLKRGGAFAADPVVRVSLSSSVVLSMVGRLDQMQHQWPENITEDL